MVMRGLLALFAVLLSVPAWAQQVELLASKRLLEAGEMAGIRVVVHGQLPSANPRVSVSPSDGLMLQFSGSMVEQSIINGQRNIQHRYDYRLTALKPGNYTVGPVQVAVGRQTLTTGTLAIQVTPRSKPLKDASEVVLTNRFAPTQAWEGQVVVYQRGVRSAQRVLRDHWMAFPDEGLQPPRDGEPRTDRTQIQQPDGSVVYQSLESFPRIAVKTGAYTYPATPVQLQLAGPGNRRRGARVEVLLTEPLTLQVMQRPGPPADFSGLVGEFTFSSRLEATKAKVGQSVSWQVEVQGNGTLEGFELPKPAEAPGYKLYDGGVAFGAKVQDNQYLAGARFSRVIVPTKPGVLQVPPIQVVVFSPEIGAYTTQTIEVPPIQVTGENAQATVESFGEDRDPNAATEPAPTVIGVYDVDPRQPSWAGLAIVGGLPLWLGLAAAPLLGLGMVQVGHRVWGLVLVYRRRAAERVLPLARLQQLPTEPDARLAELEHILRQAVARALGGSAASLQHEDACEALGEPLGEQVAALWQALDLARFAGAPWGPELEHDLTTTVRKLEALPRPKETS